MAHNPQCDGADQKQQQQKTRMSTVWSWQRCRGFPMRRRRRVQTQRLGGKKPRRRMVALVNVLRKMKQKLKYVCMVKKKLKECYRNLVKDMAEAGGSVESFHQRLFMETTFAVPIGITFSGTLYHHHRQPNKTLFM